MVSQSELVSTDNKYASIIKNLLGTTLVTTNLQVAQLLAKQLGYRYRIVSLEGDVVNAGGSMTGELLRTLVNNHSFDVTVN